MYCGVSDNLPVKKRSLFGARAKKGDAPNTAAAMALAGGEQPTLRELVHPSYNEAMKSHNAVTFKLVRTGKYITFLYPSLPNNLLLAYIDFKLTHT